MVDKSEVSSFYFYNHDFMLNKACKLKAWELSLVAVIAVQSVVKYSFFVLKGVQRRYKCQYNTHFTITAQILVHSLVNVYRH